MISLLLLLLRLIGDKDVNSLSCFSTRSDLLSSMLRQITPRSFASFERNSCKCKGGGETTSNVPFSFIVLSISFPFRGAKTLKEMSTLSSSIGTSFASATAKKNSAPFTFSSRLLSFLLAVVVIIIRFAATLTASLLASMPINLNRTFRFLALSRSDTTSESSESFSPNTNHLEIFSNQYPSPHPMSAIVQNTTPSASSSLSSFLLLFFSSACSARARFFASNFFRRGPTLKPQLLFPSSG